MIKRDNSKDAKLIYVNNTDQDIDEGIFEKALRAVEESERTPLGKRIGLKIVHDKDIQELNERYRNIAAPTDVLSFNSREGEGFVASDEDGYLGDIVISVDRASEQAENAGHSLDRELAILFIHGVLHLLGWHHEEGGENQRMMSQKTKDITSKLTI